MLLLICSCHAGVALRWHDTPLNFVKQLSLHNSKLLWLKKITRVTGVLRRTVAGDCRFDNLCRGHLQSQDGFRTGCWNVSRQQQSFSGHQSPRWSFSIKVTCWSILCYVTPGFKPFSYHNSKLSSILFLKIHGIFLHLPILLNCLIIRKRNNRLEKD